MCEQIPHRSIPKMPWDAYAANATAVLLGSISMVLKWHVTHKW